MWILLAFLLTLAVGAFVLLPYLRSQPVVAAPNEIDPRLTELYARRESLYQALRDAQLDMEMGKMTQQDYDLTAQNLKQAAATTLADIDKLEADLITPELNDMVEQHIARSRRQLSPKRVQPDVPGDSSNRYCGQCGTMTRPGDQFCASCGATLGA